MIEEVVLVDADDQPIGRAAKSDAHARNLRHRAISVLIFDGAGRMLLQQRSATKYHSAGLWSNACCSHPRPGETAEEAASRRLGEEMGFGCKLSFVGLTAYESAVGNGMTENEIVHVFVGRHEGAIEANPNEVSDFAWRMPAAIRAEMDARPERFTTWFRLYSRATWFDGDDTLGVQVGCRDLRRRAEGR